jgi:FkbM family methyltransferase
MKVPFAKSLKDFGSVTRRMRKLLHMLGLRQALYFAIHWVIRSKCITLRLSGISSPLICRPRDSDLTVLWTAFFLQDCDFNLAEPNPTIIDVGANVGYVSVFLANKYPAARIVAVEVDPDNVDILRRNVQGYNVDVVQGAIWSSHSYCCIDRSAEKSYAFRVREVPEGTPGSLPALTITDLLERLGTRNLDLLKLDIEGAEEALFAANYEEWVDRIRTLIVEIHGTKAYEAIKSVMIDRGFSMQRQGEKLVFTRTKFSQERSVALTYIPRISIVTPCYNCARFLAKTIESLLAQDMNDWELILVDDGSTDETPEIIQRYCSLDSRIKEVWQPNAGRAKACNLGVTHLSSQSKYIFFLDSDDLLVPKALQVMSSYLEAHPTAGLLTCQMQEIDGKGILGGSARRSRWVPGRFFPRQLSEDEWETPFITFFCETGQGPFALFRKSVFLRTNGFEEKLSCFSCHEDTDIFCQMALAAKVHHLAERLYLKRKHEAQITADYGRLQEGSRVFRKKWDSFRARNVEEESMLCNAKRYYYRIHAPLRNLKVACKAFIEFVQTGKQSNLWWGLRLVGDAVSGLFGRRQNC